MYVWVCLCVCVCMCVCVSVCDSNGEVRIIIAAGTGKSRKRWCRLGDRWDLEVHAHNSDRRAGQADPGRFDGSSRAIRRLCVKRMEE
jgi:hypothetical protein